MAENTKDFLTLTEVKNILDLSGTTYDTRLGVLLPFLRKQIMKVCRNSFVNVYRRVSSNGISFNKTNKTISINSTEDYFTDEDYLALTDYDFIKVYNSRFNDGVYEVAESSGAAGKVITLSSDQLRRDESANNYIIITVVEFPEELKIPAANIVKYYLNTSGRLVKQESLPSGYSVVYNSNDEVWSELNLFKKPY